MSMRVSNRTLQVFYTIAENKRVKIAVFNPEGKMVKEVYNISSNNKKQSAIIDISSLASGVYIVKLQSCEKDFELCRGKFIYTR